MAAVPVVATDSTAPRFLVPATFTVVLAISIALGRYSIPRILRQNLLILRRRRKVVDPRNRYQGRNGYLIGERLRDQLNPLSKSHRHVFHIPHRL